MATNETNKLIFGTTTYNLKDDSGTASSHTHTKSQITDFPDTSTFMQKGVDYVTAGKKSGTTLGNYATAEGYNSTASGEGSHAEGGGMNPDVYTEIDGGTASGNFSHAEGGITTASGMGSHAEGIYTTASGKASHAEGSGTTASKGYSHAEGGGTTASGQGSHAEGMYTEASGSGSHAGGLNTIAQGRAQTAIGEYNIADAPSSDLSDKGNYIFIIGNGTEINRSNALTVDWDGNVRVGSQSQKLATENYVDSAISTAITQVLNTAY